MARILLIDDDNSVRNMIAVVLGHAGHTVIETRNGTQGLALFLANTDLVLTDIVMARLLR